MYTVLQSLSHADGGDDGDAHGALPEALLPEALLGYKRSAVGARGLLSLWRSCRTSEGGGAGGGGRRRGGAHSCECPFEVPTHLGQRTSSTLTPTVLCTLATREFLHDDILLARQSEETAAPDLFYVLRKR